jgi:protein tyrosine phosphatase (PTP) superfamily phosphohydrolase (DUF442 family)
MRWLISSALIALVVGLPTWYFRVRYAHEKRLRVVEERVLYRSGQLTQAGLGDAITRFGIRTVVNLKEESPDPLLNGGLTESEYCKLLNVRYQFLHVDLLNESEAVEGKRPSAIEAFRQIMSDPKNHPVLLHCQAGLHRTGVLVARYRIDFQDWSYHHALGELRRNGFGDFIANASNDYIKQYLYLPEMANQRASRETARRIAVSFEPESSCCPEGCSHGATKCPHD